MDELASKYEFTGRTPMDVPKALEVKEELEAIDKLLKQMEDFFFGEGAALPPGYVPPRSKG